MPLAVSRQGVGSETIKLIQSDLYSKINSALSNRIGNTLEEIVFVLLRITDYDPIASSPHQFVKAHVVKVPAVAQVHGLLTIICHAEEFLGKLKGAKRGEGQST